MSKSDFLFTLPLLGIAALLGYFFLDYSLDDAFVTYRYAYNLTHGHGFVYNTGEPVLATTAPFYALLLALLSTLFAQIPPLDSFLAYIPNLKIYFDNIPRVSNLVSVVALTGTGIATYLLARRHNQVFLGALSSLLVVLSPITVLSLGMETNLQLFLIALAFLFYDSGRPFLWGLGLGLATIIRADAVLVVVVLAGHYLWTRRPGLRDLPWTAALAYLAVTVPFFSYLALQFGTPLPNSLSAKIAQTDLGFPDYLGWAPIWARDFLVPLWAFAIMGLVAIMGIPRAIQKEPWLLPILLWAVLHSVAYSLLGVAGYHWYYAPVALAGSWLVALGARSIYEQIRRWTVGKSWAIFATGALLGISFYGQVNSLWRVATSLPGPRESLYQKGGLFLNSETPPQARVAVMEVGIIGYYAQRPMIDFLGLLQRNVAQALSRGDIFWSIAHYQPEYVVLNTINPLYSYYLDPESWFAYAYQPVQTFADPGFWGSPITIYERHIPMQPLAIQGRKLGYRLGDPFQILRYDLDRTSVRAEDFLTVTLYWERIGPVTDDLKIFVHLIDGQFQIYGAHDLEIRPRAWLSGEEISTYHFLRVEEDTPPGEYFVEVGIYDPQTLKRLPVFDAAGQPTGAEIVVLQSVQVQP